MKRGCDGAVVLDESELLGKSAEMQREMLVQCIEQTVQG